MSASSGSVVFRAGAQPGTVANLTIGSENLRPQFSGSLLVFDSLGRSGIYWIEGQGVVASAALGAGALPAGTPVFSGVWQIRLTQVAPASGVRIFFSVISAT